MYLHRPIHGLRHPDALGAAIDPLTIPAIPRDHLAYVDGYGNLKTTPAETSVEIATGAQVRVRLGTVEHDAVVSDGTFAVEPGQLACAPGSSGWPTPQGTDVCWMEVFLRGGSAWELFGRPPLGTSVTVQSI